MTNATAGTRAAAPRISVLIPAKDEADNLSALLEELVRELAAETFEIIVIDDGSSDATYAKVVDLSKERPWLRSVKHAQSCGKSAALWSGLTRARGDIVVTVDGDGQNDPIYVPKLIAALDQAGPGCGIVAGQRLRRYDGAVKKWGSKVANAVRQSLLADGTRDTACGLKAIRRHVYAAMPYFDTMHRFLPALTIREGYSVAHVDVVDRKRVHGVSKYGIWDRLRVGVPDLFGVFWLRRRRKRLPHVIESSENE